MKRTCHVAFAMAVGVSLLTTVAQAKDVGGRLGLGGSHTLGGVTGLDLIYWFGDVGINGTMGFEFFNPDADGAESQTSFHFAFGGFFNLAKGEDTNLALGARINLGLFDAGQSVSQIGLELPLRVEHWFGNNFAVNAQVGVYVDIVPEDGTALDTPTTPGVRSGLGRASLLGGAGFLYYFDRAGSTAN